jgi:hypothetical protein
MTDTKGQETAEQLYELGHALLDEHGPSYIDTICSFAEGMRAEAALLTPTMLWANATECGRSYCRPRPDRALPRCGRKRRGPLVRCACLRGRTARRRRMSKRSVLACARHHLGRRVLDRLPARKCRLSGAEDPDSGDAARVTSGSTATSRPAMRAAIRWGSASCCC